MPDHPQNKPSQVVAEQGEVLMDGPDGLAVSFTPDAAEATGLSLQECAKAARDQQGSKGGGES